MDDLTVCQILRIVETAGGNSQALWQGPLKLDSFVDLGCLFRRILKALALLTPEILFGGDKFLGLLGDGIHTFILLNNFFLLYLMYKLGVLCKADGVLALLRLPGPVCGGCVAPDVLNRGLCGTARMLIFEEVADADVDAHVGLVDHVVLVQVVAAAGSADTLA